jgi:hypothetical protein
MGKSHARKCIHWGRLRSLMNERKVIAYETQW